MPELLSNVTVGQLFWVIAAIGAVTGFTKKVWPWLSRVKDFFDDLMGEPARAGVNARPGVMDRLAANENAISEIKTLAESAEYHSRPNGGASAYDGLMREVQTIKAGLAAHVVQADGIHDEQAAAIARLAEALPIVARSTRTRMTPKTKEALMPEHDYDTDVPDVDLLEPDFDAEDTDEVDEVLDDEGAPA